MYLALANMTSSAVGRCIWAQVPAAGTVQVAWSISMRALVLGLSLGSRRTRDCRLCVPTSVMPAGLGA